MTTETFTCALTADHFQGMDKLYASLMEHPSWTDQADTINQFCETVMAASPDDTSKEMLDAARNALGQLACNMLTQVVARIDDGEPVRSGDQAMCYGLLLNLDLVKKSFCVGGDSGRWRKDHRDIA